MKFFHLSDLHIGLKLMNRDLREDQEYILRQITQIAEREKPDAVVIAGDIYDKAVPSAEAVEVFDWFIGDLTKAVPEAVVMMISGNHDSASRVNCFRSVLSRQNLYMVGQPPRMSEEFIEKVTCTDAYGKVNFYLLPFVKPSMVKNVVGTNADGSNFSYEESVRRLLAREHMDCGERNVLVGHQFYLPKGMAAEDVERMDSEVRTVGNIDEVSAEVLRPFDYAALGHIHKPMNVGDERFRYCGTPLACSISEAGQQKGILMVELGAKRAADEEIGERSAEHEEKWAESCETTVTGKTCGEDTEARKKVSWQSCAVDGKHENTDDVSDGAGRTNEAPDKRYEEVCVQGEALGGRSEKGCVRSELSDRCGGTVCEQSPSSGGQCAVSCEASEPSENRCVKVEETSAGCGEDRRTSEPRGEADDDAQAIQFGESAGKQEIRTAADGGCADGRVPENLPHESVADTSALGEMRCWKTDIQITVLPLTPLRQIRVIKGTLEEVLKQPSLDYVTVVLTDKMDLEVIDMQERLRTAFPYLLEVRRETERRADYGASAEVERDMDPFELCCAFLKEMDEEEQAILLDVIRTVQEEAEE